MTLVRVVAPHFVAGMIVDKQDTVREAAPILRWAIGKQAPGLRGYFKQKGWKASRLPNVLNSNPPTHNAG